MNGEEFVEIVRNERATALRRLGSDKYLIAATGADLSAEAILRTIAASAAQAGECFRTWASEERTEAAATFETAAETEDAHYDRVVASLDDFSGGTPGEHVPGTKDEVGDGDGEVTGVEAAISAEMQSVDGTAARAGAMIGRGLVADRTRLQVVNFFVNEGDTANADLARDLRSDANEQVEAGADLLDSICETEEDWASAYDTATTVVTAAYEKYADALEAMGVDPKPVC